ncbi:hypothetical protein L211DRAFT_856999 [Terfezia boudieri ATCC MYA-4762]|uniref:protein-ribulosamine 3-kinase n=1 Tax=Terfezia boudieri ATCC MYA-4762 TaxID=1051890 RepID=A0A3N4LQC0_9PEZI|nr:hypothetical protein L211DRAFT_856999 [Terfezia boudieri ATCC MYA-4762]
MLIAQLTELDPAVQNVLPIGTTLLSIKKHGLSLWASTFKVETMGPECKPANYFLKCSLGERGRLMMEGEFEGSKAIHAVSPNFCPRPVAAGKLSFEDAYFYICEFIEMTEESPPFDSWTFCSKLAHLHKNGKSPTGMYGFHVTTCNGWIPQLNTWEQSWATFFRKGFIYLLDMAYKNNYIYPRPQGMDEHLDVFLNVVIPRLLLPLETGGNSIEPSLVHGDLWFGNAATTAEGNKPMIFDGAVFYAHNEYELGNWRPPRNKFTKAHIRDYQMHFQRSPPEEEFDDRNRLYSMRFNLHAAILFPDTQKYRQ